MLPLLFWKDWKRPSKYLFYLLLSALLVFMVLTLFFNKEGYDFAIDWEVITFKNPVAFPIDIVNVGTFSFPVVSENFLLEEFYHGSPIKVNVFSAYLFLAFIGLGVSIGLAISTTLSRLWYLIFSAVILLLIVFLRLEQLYLFGLDDNTFLIVVIVLYLTLSYYFHAVKTHFPFFERLISFLLLTAFFSVLIYFFSEVPNPFLLIISNGFILPYILGLIFCLAVAHEILHGLVFVLTRSEDSGNVLVHFFVFSIIYLISILVLFLHDTYVIDWTIAFLNPYVIMIISSLIGLWGLGNRMTLLGKSFAESTFVIFLYLILGIFFFGSTAYFMGNINDPIIQIVKDTIIYGHLGIGFLFFLYVMVNFTGMLSSGLKVHKVIYAPNNMPHFTFRIAGFIVVLALFLKSSITVPLNFTLSGAFNNVGDYYNYSGDRSNAKAYYLNGKYYGFKNHKSNYNLGHIYWTEDNKKESASNFKDAIYVRPSEYAYANLADVNRSNNQFLEGLFQLNKGISSFQGSGELWNNKGYMFDKTDISDSTYYSYNRSMALDDEEGISVSNLIRWVASQDIAVNVDSLVMDLNMSAPGSKANAMALRNLHDQQGHFELELSDTVLNIYSSSYLVNYLINSRNSFDSTEYQFALDAINQEYSLRYYTQLAFPLAVYQFYNGFHGAAIKTLNTLGSVDAINKGRYQYISGLWLLKLGYPQKSIDYFELAVANGYDYANLSIAVAETESETYTENTWNGLSMSQDSLEVQAMIEEMNKVLPAKSYDDIITIEDDLFIYQYLRVHKSDTDSPLKMELINNVDDRRIAIQLSLEIADFYVDRREFDVAVSFLEKAEELGVLESELMRRELIIAGINRNLRRVDELVQNAESLNFLDRMFFKALVQNDSVMIDQVAVLNPYNEEAVILSSSYHRNDPEELAAYNILVDALEMNSYSTILLKEYILESLRVGLTSYAEDALLRLREISDSQDYMMFKRVYDQKIKEIEESLEEETTTT